MVESSGKTGNIVGDHGAALGPLQIHKTYFFDATYRNVSNRKNYNYVTQFDFSVKIMTAYLNRYARKAIINNDYETLARIHNGGPLGNKHKSTIDYWKKVQKFL